MVICDVLVLLEMLLVLRQESLMHASVRLIEGAIIENLAWAHFAVVELVEEEVESDVTWHGSPHIFAHISDFGAHISCDFSLD